jgi:hypothetical protein
MVSSGSSRPDDYLIRQIIQLAEGIFRILGLLKDDQPREALGAIDREIESLLVMGHRAEAVFTLENAELNALLGISAINEVDYLHRCLALAALVEARGDALVGLQRESEARAAWLRALDIAVGVYEGLREQGVDYELPEFAPPLDRLRGKVAPQDLPPWLAGRLDALSAGPDHRH